jgi:hypothetical protein
MLVVIASYPHCVSPSMSSSAGITMSIDMH